MTSLEAMAQFVMDRTDSREVREWLQFDEVREEAWPRLRELAYLWADDPDYRPEWRPVQTD